MNNRVNRAVLLASATFMAFAASSAEAAKLYENKLAQWNGPELRVTCAKEAKGKWPWGKRWSVCIGHKYEWKNHAIYFEVHAPDGADFTDAIKKAAGTAAVAAAGAFAVTPGEVAIRTSAALAAAKIAFAAALGHDLASKFDLRITSRAWW